MKKFALAFALLSLAACSKTVSRNGNVFFQIEPDPTPSGSPVPVPSGSPSPTPTPSPSPTDPIGCEPDRLGDLPSYALYVEGDVYLDHVNVGKRVAANYACVKHGEIGTGLENDPNRTDLASAGKLGVDVSKIPHGKATYGSLLDKVRSTALGGFVNAPTDLRWNLRKIFEFSNACGGTPTNTSIDRVCRRIAGSAEAMSPETCTVTITGENPGLNIAELTAAQIANVSTYVINVPKGSTLVTNLPLISRAIFRGVEVKYSARSGKSPGATRTFWNFPVAEGLEFTATTFHGTVVGPDATVTVRGQDGEVGFWVHDLNGKDSEL